MSKTSFKITNATLLFTLLSISSATPAFATDTDGDGWDDASDPFPSDATRPTYSPKLEIFATDVHHGNASDFDNKMAPVDDMDGDGIADFMAHREYGLVSGDITTGMFFFSGRTGEELAYYRGGAGYRWGFDFVQISDTDGDGKNDFAVIRADLHSRRLEIVSQNGAHLFSHILPNEPAWPKVLNIGDIDNDGKDDLVVSNSTFSGSWIKLFSGKAPSFVAFNPTLKKTFESTVTYDIIDNAGDVNNDGVEDVFAYSNRENGTSVDPFIDIFSGKDLSLILKISNLPSHSNDWNEWPNFSKTGDINNDGHDDILGCYISTDTPASTLLIAYSGDDGSQLFQQPIPDTSLYCNSILPIGDYNQDSVNDFLVQNTYTTIFSGSDGSVLFTKYHIAKKAFILGTANTAGQFTAGFIYESGDTLKVYDFSPANLDSDADGMPDQWEQSNSLNYLLDDSTGDPDSDGMNNLAEYLAKTDPQDNDSDGDTVVDGSDAAPRDPTTSLDTDNDGIADGHDAFPNDASETRDSDGDGLGDNEDDLPTVATETIDTDMDWLGDNADSVAYDDDQDDDSIKDGLDNCVTTANGFQTDSDFDGLGDACDPDRDGDGFNDDVDAFDLNPNLAGDQDTDQVDEVIDNCPYLSNYVQSDSDNDGIGNACDNDIDGDGANNVVDNYPLNPDLWTTDADKDRVDDSIDNCPGLSNYVQSDSDNDGTGNACDPDVDGDGVNDASDSHPLNPNLYSDFDRDLINADNDNCPAISNYVQSDSDNDGIGNACDPDVDGDGVDDVSDNYPLNPNLW